MDSTSVPSDFVPESNTVPNTHPTGLTAMVTITIHIHIHFCQQYIYIHMRVYKLHCNPQIKNVHSPQGSAWRHVCCEKKNKLGIKIKVVTSQLAPACINERESSLNLRLEKRFD